jgi:parallel beta-helix repeat protein
LGSSGNRLRANRISGNGYATQGNNFGIGLPSPADQDNIVEDNTIVGNANGIFIISGTQGNVFRGNLVVGNPPVQVALDHSANPGVDIKNLAAAGANTFDSNVCLTGVSAPCPAVLPDANSLLASELQSVACGTYPPATSCQLTISQWNWYLTNKINPQATPLVLSDSTQLAVQITVQQYVRARAAAGL